MNTNDSSKRIAIIGGSPADAAMLRTALAGRSDVVIVGASPRLPKYASAAAQMDKELAQDLRRKQEIRDWNDAVDAKKADRQERRIERRWSRA